MSDKLNIRNEMRQFDNKNRRFYDELTEEERKKFSTFLMLRWGSAIKADKDFVGYYIQSMNQQANKHFWSLNKHPKLQWLLMSCVSPGMGTFDHEWIAFNGKKFKNKRISFLSTLYPTLNSDELEIIDQSVSNEELTGMLIDMGYEDSAIKKIIKDFK